MTIFLLIMNHAVSRRLSNAFPELILGPVQEQLLRAMAPKQAHRVGALLAHVKRLIAAKRVVVLIKIRIRRVNV